MKALLLFVLIALLSCGTAVAQTFDDDIVAVSGINYIAATGSLTFGAVEVEGKLKMPAGIIAWSDASFRFAATFPSYADTTTLARALSDTMLAGGYFVDLPGAISISATITDTLWARAYYTE